jgi:hypothetical protein
MEFKLKCCRLGNVQPEHASSILEAVHRSDYDVLVRGFGSAQWRGRMGLDKEAQIKLYEELNS